MHTTSWHHKQSRQHLSLDRRTWLFLASLAGALYAVITPLPF